MSPKAFHVAIIGAGLGGLCLAQAFNQNGIAFDVYERDASPESRAQGYRIRIDETGQRALAQCLPDDLYALFRETCGVATVGGQFLDVQLQKIRGRPVDSWRPSAIEDASDDAPGDLSANRLTLREVLLCGIQDRVHFGRSFRRYDLRDDGKVIAWFDDGRFVQSDILVAADGVTSQVREQRLPDARPVDTGSVCIYGKTIPTPSIRPQIAPELQAGTSVVFADGFAVVVDAMLFRDSPTTLAREKSAAWCLSPVDDYLYWAFIGPRDRLGVDEQDVVRPDVARLISIVGSRIQHWHPGLKALFEMGDSGTLAVVLVRTALPGHDWAANAVTFLGDAIHAMSPAGGLGANTALEDAAALFAKLTEIVPGRLSLIEAVAAYEQDMRARAAKAICASQEGARRLFSQSFN